MEMLCRPAQWLSWYSVRFVIGRLWVRSLSVIPKGLRMVLHVASLSLGAQHLEDRAKTGLPGVSIM